MIWWTKPWNPVIGCTKCSPACDNCYAEALHTQRHKAKLLVLEELRRAKVKHPAFKPTLALALNVLDDEHGELASAILKGDIHGPHGVIREAAQVAAVAIRIIEMAQYIVEHNASLKALAEIQGPCTCGWCMGCQRAKEVPNA